MIKTPSLYYSNKTKTHWLFKRIVGDKVIAIQQVMAEPRKTIPETSIPIASVEKAIADGVMVLNEYCSIAYQLYSTKEQPKRKK